jgi:ATP-binding cassette ChvD family protein
MAGIDSEIQGEARPMSGIKVGYLAQEPQLDPNKDVRGNVEDGVREAMDALKGLEQVYADYAEPDADFDALAKKQGQLEAIIDAWDAHNLETSLDIAADALRLPPWDANINALSGGEKRRVALCRLLLSRPDMLLLDEPTNHLDAESVYWLEKFLEDFSGTVVAVTHDRYFLDNVAGWILELDRGHGIPYEGNYSTWLETKEQRLQSEAKQEASRQRAIKQELEWVRQNPKGRQAKNKARLARFEELNSQDYQARNETNEIYIAPGERLGDKVIELHNLCKGYGDRLLIDDLSLSIPKGSIVGIIGGNGAGKSTLFRMIAGSEQPDSGSISLGETVKVAYVEQSRDSLNDSDTVWQAISDGLDILKIGANYEVSSRAYVGRFNFKGTDQQKRVGELSGGERGRLHLANTLKQGANVLLLDEPSNDLDIETLRALEEAILSFPGCVMVISHDRWFLDRVATHILAYEDDSQINFFEGNYSEYHADLVKRSGTVTQPKRVKHKSLKD